MDSIVGIVLAVFILAVAFLFIATKFRRVDGRIKAPFIEGEFKGTNPESQAKSGVAELSRVSGRSVKAGNIVGAKGDSAVRGEARVTEIDAEEDVEVGNIVGTE